MMGVHIMPDYEQMYTELFQKVETAIRILGKAQICVEEIFMGAPELVKMLDYDDFVDDFDDEEPQDKMIYPLWTRKPGYTWLFGLFKSF